MLDKKKYVILSDFASLQDGESSQSCIPECVMELQHDDIGLEDSNDVLMDDDEEMIEMESGSSGDELDPETSGLGSSAIEDGDLTNVLIGQRESRLRYKVSKSWCLLFSAYLYANFLVRKGALNLPARGCGDFYLMIYCPSS